MTKKIKNKTLEFGSELKIFGTLILLFFLFFEAADFKMTIFCQLKISTALVKQELNSDCFFGLFCLVCLVRLVAQAVG